MALVGERFFLLSSGEAGLLRYATACWAALSGEAYSFALSLGLKLEETCQRGIYGERDKTQ